MAFKVLHTLLEEEYFCLILGKKDCKYCSKHILNKASHSQKNKATIGRSPKGGG